MVNSFPYNPNLNDPEKEGFWMQGSYSATILKSILCIFLQDLVNAAKYRKKSGEQD